MPCHVPVLYVMCTVLRNAGFVSIDVIIVLIILMNSMDDFSDPNTSSADEQQWETEFESPKQ